MIVTQEYKNAFREVYEILKMLKESEYRKIPKDIIETIKENMNNNYEYEPLKCLKEQILLPETKAILFNLFRDYLTSTEQKEIIIKMQNEERQKLELEKREKYNIDVFKDKVNDRIEIQDEMQIIEYKESFFKKILRKIRQFFIRN